MKCSDISVGEYVRNRYGYIGKYTKNSNGIYEIKIRNGLVCRINSKEEIVKHSKNIIDLIEEGDYVNGYLVKDVVENLQTGELHLEMPMDYTNQELGDCTIYNKDIKTVVTKEQIKQIEFIVKE